MSIAVIGHGFVGSAVVNGFKGTRIVIDPKHGTDVRHLEGLRPDFVFVCVPTPMSSSGEIDVSIVRQVLVDLCALKDQPVVIVKSTVTPDALQSLLDINPSIVYNPEFLREAHADEDFVNPSMVVLGGKDTDQVRDLYLTQSLCNLVDVPIYQVPIDVASLIKYTVNSFLATKVVFFNQMKQLLGRDDMWQEFIDILSNDRRIGSSHMQVPGPDGQNGFGGSCFTKDTSALVHYAKNCGVDLSVLVAAINANKVLRHE